MLRQPITKSHIDFGLYTYFLLPSSLSYKIFLPSGPFCNSLDPWEQGLSSSWSVKVFVSPALSSLVIFNSTQHRGATESSLAMFSFGWNVEIQQRERHDCHLVAELRNSLLSIPVVPTLWWLSSLVPRALGLRGEPEYVKNKSQLQARPQFKSINLNCGPGEDSWESLGLQGDKISQS